MDDFNTLRELPLFAAASDEEWRLLQNAAQTRTYAAGERLLREGEPSEELFVLVEGTVGVFYTSASGGSVLVKIFGHPAVFGEMELLTQLPRLELVEAFEPTTAVVIPKEQMLDLWARQPACTLAMMRDLARRLCVAAYHERMLAFCDVETRLASLLLSFASAYGRKKEDGVTLRIALSHEMLGRCLGASSRSVDRVFQRWFDAGWLQRTKGYLHVASLDELKQRVPEDRLDLFNRLFDAPA